MLHFKHNGLHFNQKLTGFLRVDELDKFMIILIRLCREQAFLPELKSLQTVKLLDSNSKLIYLSPFLDKVIIKAAESLGHAEILESQKHPVILPKDHFLTQLIVMKKHYRNYTVAHGDFWPRCD